MNFASDKSVSDSAGNTALTHVSITRAKSYDYCYGLSNPGSFAAAAESLNVNSARTVNAYAKVYNGNAAGPDVYVSTTVNNGNLLGYNNMAIASANLGYAFQSFDSATGTIQCDSVAKNLPSKWSNALETSVAPEASISTKTIGTINDYEDAVVKSSSGTSIEQNAGMTGTFTSKSTAETKSITRTSNYGTNYDMDMQANIASGSPSVAGTLTYYIDPSQVVQKAVHASKNGDTVTLAAGAYDQNVNIGKKVTVRGQGVTGSITNPGAITNNNGGKNYVNAKEVFVRADDYYTNSGAWQWYTDLVNSEGIKTTIGVIPGLAVAATDVTTIGALQSLSKNNFELATHGLNHELLQGQDFSSQFSIISQATNLMTKYWYKPRTFITPFGAADVNTLVACEDLGYHTLSSGYKLGDSSLNQIAWENGGYEFDDGSSTYHRTFGEFKSAFDGFYNSNAQTYIVMLHPNTYWQDTDRSNFAQSIDYMNGKNVEFLTMDQAYRYGMKI